MNSHTPMMQQYLSIKSQYQDILLFFRMGDFYELFFEDAQIAANILDITLTQRSGGTHAIKMAGVPYHAADNYIGKLLANGHSVAICEQIGEVPLKGLVERKVVKVITSGTITESSYLDEKQVNYLLSIAINNNYHSIAWLDIASGNMFCQSFNNLDEIIYTIQKIHPAEIIASKEIYDLIETNINITVVPDWYFNPKTAQNFIIEELKIQNTLAFEIDNKSSYAACASLLHYLKQTQGMIPNHIQGIKNIKINDYLNLDADTIDNLELLKTIKGHKSPTLFSLLDICKTNMGSRYLKQKITQPSNDTDQIINTHNAIECLINNPKDLNDINTLLGSIFDIERINARLALKQAKPKDLSSLRQSLILIPQITAVLFNIPMQCEALNSIAMNLNTPFIQKIIDFLNKSIACEPNTWLRDGGVIADGYSSELDELRNIYLNSQNILLNLENQEKQRSNINNLKIEYNKIHGFYIEITQGQLAKVPSNYVRRQTLKNAERFITPELKEFEDKFLSAKEKSLALEKQIFEEILNNLLPYTHLLKSTAVNISTLDYICALGKTALKYNWAKPIMSNDSNIEIIQGKHPVVMQHSQHFTANDCMLSHARRLLLITGPNMGGKSTFMRQTALIVLLAYMGSFVPAQKAYIGKIDRIFTRIGASDDVASGQSTFMVEMRQAATILNQANNKSLVLMDEVGRGTSTADGVALAQAIASYLANKNQCLTLFSTHYFELTNLSNIHHCISNIHFSAVEHQNHIVFLHAIKSGVANQSYGVQVARLAGLPKQVIENAKHYLSENNKNVQDDTQLNLFALDNNPNAENHKLTYEIQDLEKTIKKYEDILSNFKNMDINSCTPKQALDIIFDLHTKIN